MCIFKTQSNKNKFIFVPFQIFTIFKFLLVSSILCKVYLTIPCVVVANRNVTSNQILRRATRFI